MNDAPPSMLAVAVRCGSSLATLSVSVSPARPVLVSSRQSNQLTYTSPLIGSALTHGWNWLPVVELLASTVLQVPVAPVALSERESSTSVFGWPAPFSTVNET